jgi:dienelactone hydrolase
MSGHANAQRMRQQQWLYDRLIRADGPDFYWPMSEMTLCAAGVDASGDIRMIRSSIKKFVDITRELTRVGDKRANMARQAEGDGRLVTARQNYFTAAAFYTMAQGPIHEDGSAVNIALSEKKNACYDKFIEYAGHRIERVELPFQGTTLPGYLHFPPGASGKPPCVVLLGGMDSFKEILVTSPTDKFLERGMAVLCFDGPGQNDARIMRKVCVTATNFVDAGRTAMDFLLARTDIDTQRIGIVGTSMATYWITQIVADDHRYKAAAGFYVCHESGMDTIFNMAIPVFKDRFMWMSGYNDEAKFDAFLKTLTLDGLGAKIRCPYLTVAGEDDHLSPIEDTYKLHDAMSAPNHLVVYRREGHGVTDNMDARAYIADWILDRLNGKPIQTQRIYMDCRSGTGIEVK